MRDFITPIGGFLVIGAQIAAVFAALVLTYRVAYRRGKRAECERAIATQQQRIAKILRSMHCAPSPITLTLSGYPDDASAAEKLCQMFSGTDRIVEEG